MNSNTNPVIRGIIGIGLAIAATGLATAQQPAPAVLSAEPMPFDSIGLTLHLPLDARVESSRVGGKTTATILPNDGTWMITLQVHDTANQEATIAEALQNTIALVQQNFGTIDPKHNVIKETRAQIVDRIDELHIGDQTAARVYIRTPDREGNYLFRGYTIFKPFPKQFVVFDLTAPNDVSTKAREIYELTVASAKFQDPAVLMMERGAAVKAGVQLLSRMGADDWKALLDGKERWYREYRPAPGGDQADAEEVGYRTIKAWQGRLGEINPTKGRDRWSAAERREGRLVRVAGRHLVQVFGRDAYVDFEGIYFLSPDRESEAWQLRTVVRSMKNEQMVSATEAGFREGDELEINIKKQGEPNRVTRPLIMGEGYTSQVEHHLLPFILARSGLHADFGFYVYQSQDETIALRRDSVEQTSAGAGVTVETRYRAEQDPRRWIFNGDGELTRAENPEGVVMEPTTPEVLMNIWRKKGLPTGSSR